MFMGYAEKQNNIPTMNVQCQSTLDQNICNNQNNYIFTHKLHVYVECDIFQLLD